MSEKKNAVEKLKWVIIVIFILLVIAAAGGSSTQMMTKGKESRRSRRPHSRMMVIHQTIKMIRRRWFRKLRQRGW